MKSILFLICFTTLLFSCKKDNAPFSMHENYFPITEGQFVEYDVIEIRHGNPDGKHETLNYVLKTRIGDSIFDNSGRIANKFLRFKYDSLINEFKIKDVWTCILDQNRIELVEENERKIKLIFSPTTQKEWDINAFNSQKEILATYQNIHQPMTLNGLSFDSTLTVLEEKTDPPSLIDYNLKFEIYAKNVGLIYKYYKSIAIQNFDTLNPIQGIEYYYSIRKYGKE